MSSQTIQPFSGCFFLAVKAHQCAFDKKNETNVVFVKIVAISCGDLGESYSTKTSNTTIEKNPKANRGNCTL